MYYIGALSVYILTIIKCLLVSVQDIEIRNKRNIWLIVGTIPVILIPILLTRSDVTYYEDVVAIGLIWFILFVHKRKKSIIIFLCYALIIISVSYIVENGIHLFSYLTGTEIGGDFLSFWLVQALAFLLTPLAAILLRRLYRMRETYRLHKAWNLYGFLLFVVALVVNLTISGLNELRGFNTKPRFQIVILIISMLAYTAIVILGLIALTMYLMNANLEEMLLQESELRKMQSQYHALLVEKDYDTRKFRHDTTGHLIHVMELAKQENAMKTLAYLTQYSNELGDIQRKCVDTGAEELDIIMNYFLSHYDEETALLIVGKVQQNTKFAADDYDICTVLSNVFQNINDEFRRISGKKEIMIEFHQSEDFLNVKIANSMAEDKWNQSVDELTKSKKQDKENHGFGLMSIQSTMSKSQGVYRYYVEKNQFVNDLFFKIHTVR